MQVQTYGKSDEREKKHLNNRCFEFVQFIIQQPYNPQAKVSTIATDWANAREKNEEKTHHRFVSFIRQQYILFLFAKLCNTSALLYKRLHFYSLFISNATRWLDFCYFDASYRNTSRIIKNTKIKVSIPLFVFSAWKQKRIISSKVALPNIHGGKRFSLRADEII